MKGGFDYEERNKKMNVLSLFDGISCGMVALERAGIQVDRYKAYEIDENAIKISKFNYPQNRLLRILRYRSWYGHRWRRKR